MNRKAIVMTLMLSAWLPLNAMIRHRTSTQPNAARCKSVTVPICAATRKFTTQRIPLITAEMSKTLAQNIHAVVDRMYNPRHHRLIGLHPVGGTTRAFEYPWLPHCILKTQEQPGSRLAGAQRLRASIIIRNSHLLELPIQEEYTIPEEVQRSCPYAIPTSIIVAKKIIGIHDAVINRAQAQQLKELLQDTYYYDCSSKNLVHTPQGTIGLIDTELRGFSPVNSLSHCLRILLNYNQFTPDAEEYLKQALEKTKI